MSRTHGLIYAPKLPSLEQINLDQIPKAIPGIRDSIVAAIMYNGQVLMALRGGDIGRDQWALIGGKTDPEETLRQALHREVFEEIGVTKLKNIRPVHIHYSHAPDQGQTFRVIVVRVEIELDEIPVIKEPDKILALQWFKTAHMPHKLFSAKEFYEYRDKL